MMKNIRYLFLALPFLMISCGGEASEGSGDTSDITTDDTLQDEVLEGDEYEYKIEIPVASVNDGCLPYPSDKFIEQMENNSVPSYGMDAGYLYSYIVAHFDSLESRQYVAMEDEWDMGVYDWSQTFSGGITYSEFFGGEGGATATIETECTDQEGIYSTLNALVNYKYLGSDWEHDGYWNEDNTEYAPEGGAGCYYNVLLDDSTGYYYISNYCGC